VQFDVHAQVIGVELELVARPQSAVFIDVQMQRSDRTVE
jgi:hypothetical protein